MAEKFLFSKGFEVFSTEDYAVANPIAKRDYSETYRLTRRKDGRPFLMKVYLTDSMPDSLKFGREPRLISYLNTSGISGMLPYCARASPWVEICMASSKSSFCG